MIVRRNTNGKLEFRNMDFELKIFELFEKCRNEEEIEFLKENMIACIEYVSEEIKGEIENERN